MRVPAYQQTETLRPISRTDLHANATADAFGGAIAEGVNDLGRGVSNFSAALQAVQDKDDETEAKDRVNQLQAWRRNALFDPEAGYLTTQGKNALDARKPFEDNFAKEKSRLGEGLSTHASRMYAEASGAVERDTLETSIRHASTQRKAWVAETSVSRQQTFADDALVAFNDPKLVNKNIMGGILEIRERSKDEGWDPATRAQKEHEYESGVRKNITLRMAETDPIGAKSYLDKNRDRMSGSDQYDLDKALKDGVKNEQSKRETDRILGVGKGSADSASAVVRKFEGFRATPYWDVNANRIGYGSDTITRADGRVERVAPGMSVTSADAERDLERRVGEFQRGIVKDVGQEAWDKLPPNAQAALSSVAYNYGRLPTVVAGAVATGNTEQIAKSIEGLQGHNDGVNRQRRLDEASIVRGDMAAGGDRRAPTANFVDIERELAGITDPDVRDLTRKRINIAIEAQSKASEAAEKAAKSQLFDVVENGGSPDDAPFEVRRAAGMGAVSSAWEYHDKKTKRGTVETDEEQMYYLRRAAAEDPVSFSQIDLNEQRSNLSNESFKELSALQVTAIENQRKAKDDGAVLTGAFSQAKTQLQAVGIDATGLKGSSARMGMAKREAKFQNALYDRIGEFQKENKRNPNTFETQTMINQLLLPIVMTDKNAWFGGRTEGFAFEAGSRADGVDVEVNVNYTDVPIDIRRSISATFEAKNGRKPTEADVTGQYEEFLKSR